MHCRMTESRVRIDPNHIGDSHVDPDLTQIPHLDSDASATHPPASPASRLCLESLEDRCLLSFSPAVNYPVGANPQAVVTGDFNGDGRLDLAVANSSSNTVSILLGNANGTFQAAQNFATGACPSPWPWATSTRTASWTS